MKNFKVTIEYDGSNYFGWQRQGPSGKMPTVQGVIEKAVKQVLGKKIPVIAAGRTDTGVHALAQVASFKVNTRLGAPEVRRALNSYLPPDILIKDVLEVPLRFHARYGAKRKWYRYSILTSALPSVFHRHYTLHYPYPLDLGKMRKAAGLMCGRHDFSGIGCGKAKYKVREIYDLNVKKNGSYIYIDVTGNGFLYKMVRRLVGVLIDAGRDKVSLEEVADSLSGNGSGFHIQTAPAAGLCLMRVEY